MDPTIVLAALVTLIFTLLGTAKILAVPPMSHLAGEVGFSVGPTGEGAAFATGGRLFR